MRKSDVIAQVLRGRIADGTYPPGAKIPAIPRLMEEFDCARETVRAAIQGLANEGLLTARSGVGTIVRDRREAPLTYRPDAQAQPWKQQHPGGSDQVVYARRIAADAGVAERLGIERGAPVIHLIRHITLADGDERAIAWVGEQWIPADLADAVQKATGHDLADQTLPRETQDVNVLLARAGHAPIARTETSSARNSYPEEWETLGLPSRVPVLVVDRVTVSEKGPVETAVFFGAGDRVRISHTTPLQY